MYYLIFSLKNMAHTVNTIQVQKNEDALYTDIEWFPGYITFFNSLKNIFIALTSVAQSVGHCLAK